MRFGQTSQAIIECNSTTVGEPCDTDNSVCTIEVCAQVGPDVECLLLGNQDDGESFSGGRTLAFEPKLVLGAVSGRVAVALNLGYRVRGRSQLANLVVDDEVTAARFPTPPSPRRNYDDLQPKPDISI